MLRLYSSPLELFLVDPSDESSEDVEALDQSNFSTQKIRNKGVFVGALESRAY